jgi:hypothetical protein
VFVILSHVLQSAGERRYKQASDTCHFVFIFNDIKTVAVKQGFDPQIYFYILRILAIGLFQFDAQYFGYDSCS